MNILSRKTHDTEAVRRLAYAHWEARGCPHGSADADWLRAEEELKQRGRRVYRSNLLPTLNPSGEGAQHDLLLGLYREKCTSWRMLRDVRFKLLALVPTVSLLAVINLLGASGFTKELTPYVRVVIAVIGCCVTAALLVYERRNSQLYYDLISRGRKIEEELDVDTGQFRGRLRARFRILGHDTAIYVVYLGAILVWCFAAAIVVIQAGWWVPPWYRDVVQPILLRV
jgi:hypothetical protein